MEEEVSYHHVGASAVECELRGEEQEHAAHGGVAEPRDGRTTAEELEKVGVRSDGKLEVIWAYTMRMPHLWDCLRTGFQQWKVRWEFCRQKRRPDCYGRRFALCRISALEGRETVQIRQVRTPSVRPH